MTITRGLSVYASRIPHCDCPQCSDDGELEWMSREEAERLRAEIARSPDFIRDLVMSEAECTAVSAALVAGDHGALARTLRAALERALDEEIERYRFTRGFDRDGALEAVHRVYAGGAA